MTGQILLEHFVKERFILFEYHQVFIVLYVKPGCLALVVRSDLDAGAG